MSYPLNNFIAPDAYLIPGTTGTNAAAQTTGPATLDPLPTVVSRITFDVYNQAIYWQIYRIRNTGAGPSNGGWEPEVYLAPGSKTIIRDNIGGVRVRAALTAAALAPSPQAQVTVEAITD